MKIINHGYMKSENINTIYECIRKYGVVTKREIQKLTNLSWGTISAMITLLLEKKLIEETDTNECSGQGRPPAGYDISDNLLVIGLDINVEGLKAVLMDMKCKIFHSVKTSPTEVGSEYILTESKKMVAQLFTKAKELKRDVSGIGIALMGAVDTENGISIYAQHIKGWQNIQIKKIFEDEFNVPVLIDHDPNCMALAEICTGNINDTVSALFIRLSFGIGMSIVLDGRIYRGFTGNAGEFGHTVVSQNGLLCSCGKQGCLETFSSAKGIVSRFRQQSGIPDPINEKPEDLLKNFNSLAHKARCGDAKAMSFFTDAGKYLGMGISSLINILDPSVVVMGGFVMDFDDLFMDEITSAAQKNIWPYSVLNLQKSRLSEFGASTGAGALFIRNSLWLKFV